VKPSFSPVVPVMLVGRDRVFCRSAVLRDVGRELIVGRRDGSPYRPIITLGGKGPVKVHQVSGPGPADSGEARMEAASGRYRIQIRRDPGCNM